MAFRPPCVAAWTSSRYVFFRRAKVSDNPKHRPRASLTYLQHCWNVCVAKMNDKAELMQLLPPLCFTDSHFIR